MLSTLDPSGVPSWPLRVYRDEDLNEDVFRKIWVDGVPLVVTGLLDKFKIKWTPDYFKQQYGADPCQIMDCDTGVVEAYTVSQFFGLFGDYHKRMGTGILKLKVANISTMGNNKQTKARRS